MSWQVKVEEREWNVPVMKGYPSHSSGFCWGAKASSGGSTA